MYSSSIVVAYHCAAAVCSCGILHHSALKYKHRLIINMNIKRVLNLIPELYLVVAAHELRLVQLGAGYAKPNRPRLAVPS